MNNKQKNRKTKKNGGSKNKNKKENSPHSVAVKYITDIMRPYNTIIRPNSKSKKTKKSPPKSSPK
jgi:hypothetical protein